MGNILACKRLVHTGALTSQTQQQGNKKNLKVNSSEEDYLPMPLSMRRALIDGRKFQHMVPGKGTTADVKTNEEKENLQGKLNMGHDKIIKKSESQLSDQNVLVETERFRLGDVNKESEKGPEMHPVVELKPGKKNLSDFDDGVRKSKFSLQMEQKLRNTRFELMGLQSEEWKEFSFKYNKGFKMSEKSKSWMRSRHDIYSSNSSPSQESETKLKPANLKGEMTQENVTHEEREDCKCRVCELAHLTEMSPSEVAQKKRERFVCNTKKEVEYGDDEDCYKQVKTNGTYQFQKDRIQFSSQESVRNSENDDLTNRKIREQFRNNNYVYNSESEIRNTDYCPQMESKTKNGQNSVEDLVKHGFSNIEPIWDRVSSQKINNVFLETKHNLEALKDNGFSIDTPLTEQHKVENKYCLKEEPQVFVRKCIYKVEQNSRDADCGRIMWIGLPVLEHEKNEFPFSKSNEDRRDRSRKSSSLKDSQTVAIEERGSPILDGLLVSRKASSVKIETSPSSSLATIMSYNQVRQIFQTIVESNQPRRKMKRNIAEFRNMEELGLGKVCNRRWYPGADKTMSILSGLHASTTRVQAQFRKYNKPV